MVVQNPRNHNDHSKKEKKETNKDSKRNKNRNEFSLNTEISIKQRIITT